jgi:hypothetical protein
MSRFYQDLILLVLGYRMLTWHGGGLVKCMKLSVLASVLAKTPSPGAIFEENSKLSLDRTRRRHCWIGWVCNIFDMQHFCNDFFIKIGVAVQEKLKNVGFFSNFTVFSQVHTADILISDKST